MTSNIEWVGNVLKLTCSHAHTDGYRLRHLLPDDFDYPAVLLRNRHPPQLFAKGNLLALNNTLLGVFCSVKCCGDVILKTYDLARSLRSADVTIIGGFQSPMEKECLELLLRGTASVVVCPARGLGRMRVTDVYLA